MNYEKIYSALVEKAKVRGLDKSQHEGYFEIHHIIPRCLGGSNEKDNLVMFTAREHFIAHLLLWKAFPNEDSLMRAAMLMSSFWRDSFGGVGVRTSSRLYETLRKEYAAAVSVQVSGTGNPFYGKSHSQEVLNRIAATRRLTTRKTRLLNWKNNNEKYMAQYHFKLNDIQPFLINGTQDVGNFNHKLTEESCFRWVAAELYKDFWLRSGKTGRKFFATDLTRVTGYENKGPQFLTMIKMFSDGWEPSQDSKWLCLALNSKTSEDAILTLEKSLSKTLNEVKKEYLDSWLENRLDYRLRIDEASQMLGLDLHKNVSKNIMSQTDAIEAHILWRSNLVEQKQIAALYDVKRNSISNVVETPGRWQNVRDSIKQIEEYVFGKRHCTS